jgi:hypothetical protein
MMLRIEVFDAEGICIRSATKASTDSDHLAESEGLLVEQFQAEYPGARIEIERW